MEIEPLASDLPYPSLSDVEPDPRVLEMFYDAYSAQHSELNAILQYVYHQLIFDSLEMYDVSRVYACIFVSEMEHLHQLGKAIIRLGGNPRYLIPPTGRGVYYSAACVSYSNEPCQMLLDDIAGENKAIAEYNMMLARLGDAKVGALIRRIIMDEEMHLAALKEYYAKMCNV